MKARFRHKRIPRDKFWLLESAIAYERSDGGRPESTTPYYLEWYSKPRWEDDRFDPHERGGITLCELVEDDEVVAQGVAYCSPKDAFVKSIGRAIARGRAEKQLG